MISATFGEWLSLRQESDYSLEMINVFATLLDPFEIFFEATGVSKLFSSGIQIVEQVVDVIEAGQALGVHRLGDRSAGFLIWYFYWKWNSTLKFYLSEVE
jgi:hypothetical protein